jgi:hypothetical protein
MSRRRGSTNFRLQDTEEQSAVHGKIKKLKGPCHEGKAVQIYCFTQEMKGTMSRWQHRKNLGQIFDFKTVRKAPFTVKSRNNEIFLTKL